MNYQDEQLINEYKQNLLNIYKNPNINTKAQLGGMVSGAGRTIKAKKKAIVLKSFVDMYEGAHNIILTARAIKYISGDLFGTELTETWLKKNNLIKPGISKNKQLKEQKERYDKDKTYNPIIRDIKSDYEDFLINMKNGASDDEYYAPFKEEQEQRIKENEEILKAEKEKQKAKKLEIDNKNNKIVNEINDINL